jgi:predicted ATPase/DNA-binding SARP family transcriptional activator/Tfp pilus assembly protein PilF
LEVRLDGQPVSRFEYNKVRALLVYLAVEASYPHTRASLCALLWPDLPERVARQNLSQALTRLRHALGDIDAPTPLLLVTTDTVQLNPEAAGEVDATRFVSLIEGSEAHAHHNWRTCTPCAERLREAVTLYRGDFLARFYLSDNAPFEEWALLLREQLRQRALAALERLAQYAEWRGQYEQAVDYARRQVTLEPLREGSQHELMRLLALSGQRSAALSQYEALCRTLDAELGAAPEAKTTALHAAIQSNADEAAMLRRLQPPPSHLPTPPTRLIGRAVEVHKICDRLWTDVRALTVTGPPGIGKTRLALEVAHRLRFDFEDGVHFVELALLDGAHLVPAAIAQILDVKEQAGKTLAATLAAYLRDKYLLLVLDNFEHVLGAASFVAELLAACPELKVLLTSRAPLRIRAEQQILLTPLDAAEAVQLFVERARMVHPGFTITTENETDIAALCRQVDHLPLGIELIAVRVKTLSPADVLNQVDQRLEALANGSRDLPERHRTLRHAIAWSYNRLSADEQQVFAHLGVFAGGCTAEAAQAVVGEKLSVLPMLEALHESSLVQVQSAAGETRFSLLETLREFALEQLGRRDELLVAQERHAVYFTRLAERAQPQLHAPTQNQWLDRLERDHDNLRAALTRAIRAGDDSGLRLAAALYPFWDIRGYLSEGRRWLAQALETGPHAAMPLRGRALQAAGSLASRQGDYAGAHTLYEQSLSIWHQLEDGPAMAQVFRGLGILAYNQGDNASAKSYYEQSLDIARQCGDARGIAATLNNLGLVAAEQGNDAQARSLYQECLALARTVGDKIITGNVLLNLGLLASQQADPAAARSLMDESLTTFREIGHEHGAALTLLNLGNVVESQADLAAAETYFQESLRLYRAVGDLADASYAVFGLGKVAYQKKDYATARTLFRESLTLRYESDEKRAIARNLEGIAQVDRTEGQAERAARLFGAAEALRESLDAPITPPYLPEYQREVSTLRAALSEAAFEKAWSAGRALTLEQAIVLALALTPGER